MAVITRPPQLQLLFTSSLSHGCCCCSHERDSMVLYVFLVDTGSMLTFDMNLAVGR